MLEKPYDLVMVEDYLNQRCCFETVTWQINKISWKIKIINTNQIIKFIDLFIQAIIIWNCKCRKERKTKQNKDSSQTFRLAIEINRIKRKSTGLVHN